MYSLLIPNKLDLTAFGIVGHVYCLDLSKALDNVPVLCRLWWGTETQGGDLL